MGIGDTIKANVDAVRDMLGSSCTIAGTDIGKCSWEDLTPDQTQSILGLDYSDEISLPWAMIECPAETTVVEGDLITVTVSGKSWIVRRVLFAFAGDVIIAKRCLCVGKTL